MMKYKIKYIILLLLNSLCYHVSAIDNYLFGLVTKISSTLIIRGFRAHSYMKDCESIIKDVMEAVAAENKLKGYDHTKANFLLDNFKKHLLNNKEFKKIFNVTHHDTYSDCVAGYIAQCYQKCLQNISTTGHYIYVNKLAEDLKARALEYHFSKNTKFYRIVKWGAEHYS